MRFWKPFGNLGNPKLPQPEFPQKERVLRKLDRSCDVTGRVNIITLSFSLEVQAEKTDSGFVKTFHWVISLYLLNIFVTTAPK